MILESLRFPIKFQGQKIVSPAQDKLYCEQCFIASNNKPYEDYYIKQDSITDLEKKSLFKITGQKSI